ncbi:MAG: hypothetical protein F9K24_22215 [Leptonema illini]|uniref:Uncharacterized protein n=1 Tax=Leptonema illini TaxID=183 RepID=A0A833GW41_9LEPT|nr:MAG: hypothetical protein F9K24_22215 [Leptonema illini]
MDELGEHPFSRKQDPHGQPSECQHCIRFIPAGEAIKPLAKGPHEAFYRQIVITEGNAKIGQVLTPKLCFVQRAWPCPEKVDTNQGNFLNVGGCI